MAAMCVAGLTGAAFAAEAPKPRTDWRANYEKSGVDQSKGACATIWFEDDYYFDERHNPPPSIALTLCRQAPKKGARVDTVQYLLRREQDGWRLEMKPVPEGARAFYTAYDSLVSGWNRFDAVLEADGRVTFYFNGRFFWRSDEMFAAFRNSTVHLFKVGEAELKPGAGGFRPNPVRALAPEYDRGIAWLGQGEKLGLSLALDAARHEGRVTYSLRTAQNVSVAARTFDLKDGSAARMDVEVPRSGLYWLVAEYVSDREPHPLVSWRALDVQYVTAAERAYAPIVLSGAAWDFLPRGKLCPMQRGGHMPEPTAEDLAVPETVPDVDWTTTEKLRGFWRGVNADPGRSYQSAWYHQRVTVPEAWKGQDVKLRLEEPYTVAKAFVNGKPAGLVEWPGGELPLKGLVRPGETADITIFVKGDPLFGMVRVCREIAGEAFKNSRPSDVRGLVGRVQLEPVATGSSIDDVFIKTSLARHELSVDFDLSGLERGRKYALTGEASAAGAVKCRLEPTVFVATAAVQTVTARASWRDPVLWELYKPYLYDFAGALSDDAGRVLSRTFPERFGFREIDAKGPTLKLNGRNVTLMLSTMEIVRNPWCYPRYHDTYFNALYKCTGPSVARLLDELGMTARGDYAMLEPSLHALVLARLGKLDDPRLKPAVRAQLEKMIRLMRNRPSGFFRAGVLGGGRNGNGGMYNPYFANGTWVARDRENEVREKGYAFGKWMLDEIHRLDPTRPATAQDSGSINDIRQITEYPGFCPFQELIEMGLYWREVSEKPFMISEQASPFYSNWTDDCREGKGWHAVPCLQEWAAITHGDAAWERDGYSNYWLAECERLTKPGDRMKMPIVMMQATTDGPLHCAITHERTVLQALYNRAWGIGMVCPQFVGGPCKIPMNRELQAPVTGFLCGREEKITLRDHLYRPGETLRRGLMLLNNFCEDRDLTYAWKLTLGGRIIAEKRATAKIPAGGQAFVPITVALSNEAGDISGELSASFAVDGETLRSDVDTISVLVPRKPALTARRIAVVDPDGDTARELRRLGVCFHSTMFDEDLSAYDLVVFGRKAFRYEYALLKEGLDLGKLVASGTRVVILEQDEETLRERFRFRTEYVSPRWTFGRWGESLLAGLPNDCLRHWRGEATLTDGYLPAKQQGVNDGFGNGGTWLYLWNDGREHRRPMKWGNTHNVATVVVMKPETGNFRPLVDCEYAADYVAAWELDVGAGRIVFSQMDVSGRTEKDPAADRYLLNLLEYARTSPVVAPRRVAYWGGDAGAKLLKSVDVPFQPVGDLPKDAASAILVVGDLPADGLRARKEALAAFAEAGGQVVSLMKDKKTLESGWTPFAVEAEEKTINQTLVGRTADPLLAGLGSADFFYKGNVSVTTVRSNVLARVPCGKGSFVFVQFAPSMFGDTVTKHWLKWSARVSERTIRQVFANLGAELSRPRFLEPPKSAARVAMTLDLTGAWEIAQGKPGVETPPGEKAFRKIAVPGCPQKTYPDWQTVKGRFWYRRFVKLPKELPAGAKVRVVIGNISGCNVLTVNGKVAAFTDTDTDINTVACMVRAYELEASLFHRGTNEFVLKVDFDRLAQLGLAGSTGAIEGSFDLTVLEPRQTAALREPISLEGSDWWAQPVMGPDPKLWKQKARKRIRVPGTIQFSERTYAGVKGWYLLRHQFALGGPLAEGSTPFLELGCVCDEDDTYLNGVKIGHTGKDTNPRDYWCCGRLYPIDPKLLKETGNDLLIVCNDHNAGGGIRQPPARIVFVHPDVARRAALAVSPYLHVSELTDDPYRHHGY